MTTTSRTANQTDAFKLRMRSLTLPILQILDIHLDIIENQLEQVKIKTPNLFNSSPMVLDMDLVPNVNDSSPIDLPKLYVMLKRYGIIPVGIQVNPKGVNAFYEEAAKKAGIAVFTPSRSESSPSYKEPVVNEQKSSSLISPNTLTTERVIKLGASKLITKPIRSGQQVYAENSDLIVLSSVSPGAELLADGNIHVYGTLRGRALAGIQGNNEARIFCQNLEADLLSIAGCYMISDVIDRYRKKGAQQIYLENDKLQIETL